MPQELNGEITLSWRKGSFCWLCVIIYMSLWAAAAYAFYTHELDKGGLLCMIGQGTFGIVPILFFAHERRRVTKDTCQHLQGNGLREA